MEGSANFPMLSAVPLSPISPERPQPSLSLFTSASASTSSASRVVASTNSSSSSSVIASMNSSSSVIASMNSSSSMIASTNSSSSVIASTNSSSRVITSASSRNSCCGGQTSMMPCPPAGKDFSQPVSDVLKARRKWLKAAIDLEALRQKNLEEEIRLSQKKLQLERLRLMVQEQRMKQLTTAQKQAHMKHELLKTIRNRQLARDFVPLEDDDTEIGAIGRTELGASIENNAPLRKEFGTASDVKNIVKKIEQVLENASVVQKGSIVSNPDAALGKEVETALDENYIADKIGQVLENASIVQKKTVSRNLGVALGASVTQQRSDANHNTAQNSEGSLKRKSEEQMSSQPKRKDAGETKNENEGCKVEIDLTEDCQPEERKELPVAPAPCHTKASCLSVHRYSCKSQDTHQIAT